MYLILNGYFSFAMKKVVLTIQGNAFKQASSAQFCTAAYVRQKKITDNNNNNNNKI